MEPLNKIESLCKSVTKQFDALYNDSGSTSLGYEFLSGKNQLAEEILKIIKRSYYD